MNSEDECSSPEFAEQTRAMQELLAYLHDISRDTAEINTENYWASESNGSVDHSRPPSIRSAYVEPHNPASLTVEVTCEQWIVIEMGRPGGRWELGYDSADLAHAKALLAAAVAGRVTETSAFGRSKVDVTLADGSTVTETGYEGCLPFLLVLPGWTKWGRKTKYESYRASEAA